MTSIGLFRCRENETKCPLTNCFRSLSSRQQGLAGNVDELCAAITKKTGLPCVKGPAHLPEGYSPQLFHPERCFS